MIKFRVFYYSNATGENAVFETTTESADDARVRCRERNGNIVINKIKRG